MWNYGRLKLEMKEKFKGNIVRISSILLPSKQKRRGPELSRNCNVPFELAISNRASMNNLIGKIKAISLF